MNEKQVRPYGLWSSPISARLLSQSIRLADVQWDTDGKTLVWLEWRSDRTVAVMQTGKDGPCDVTDELTPRGGVGYGGGDYGTGHGQIAFPTGEGRLYIKPLGLGAARPITPAFGGQAAPVISPDGRWIAFISSYERSDALALVDSQGAGWPVKLAAGADFYMQPAWHPDGDQIAWVEWDHPNMPWDGTRLAVGRLAGSPPVLIERQIIAGGADTPVFQPAFSPDGCWLSFIVQDGEWDELIAVNLTTGERRVLAQDASLLVPAWAQGDRTYGWSCSSNSIFFLRNEGGFFSLWQVFLADGTARRIELPGYTHLAQPAVSPTEDVVAVIGSGPAFSARLITVRVSPDGAGQVRVVRRTTSESLEPGDLPLPQSITWEGSDGAKIHGLYFAPVNARFTAHGAPPAIINIHGGPTSQVMANFSLETAFFTSRGYAVLAVNYRGSTGFGRSYMLALRQKWGDYDVQDAVSGAQALVEQGLADPQRLVIRGGSAGGYTVLNALIHYPGRFKAGLCSFGVSNLFTLAMDTHKFEERYLDSMVGTLPEASARYHAWSPIFQANLIKDAIAVFQGSADKVVPPDQSESIVAALRANGVPHIYRLYEGEGHGFRKIETLEAHYQDVERFLQQHVCFSG